MSGLNVYLGLDARRDCGDHPVYRLAEMLVNGGVKGELIIAEIGCFNLMRASAVVKRQSTYPVCSSCWSSHALTSLANHLLSAIRRRISTSRSGTGKRLVAGERLDRQHRWSTSTTANVAQINAQLVNIRTVP